MCRQDDERDALLIDRLAAAEVPREEAVREWARDKRAFISSVMVELREERTAAANGVRSLGAQPVMFEEFGGRDADPLNAYLHEVENQPDLCRYSSARATAGPYRRASLRRIRSFGTPNTKD